MSEDRPSLRQYLEPVKRHGWLIVLVPALALLIAGFLVSRQKSVYRASMGIFVAQAGGTANPLLGNLPVTQTMTNVIQSDVVAAEVKRDLHLRLTSSELLSKLGVQVNPDSSVLNVTYDSSNKAEALRILGAVGNEFNSLIRQRFGVSGSFQHPGPLHLVVSIFDAPHLEPGRVSPKPGQVLAFAAGLGLVLGLILAFARNALEDRIRGRDEAEESFGSPVIGVLPEGFVASRTGESIAGSARAAHALVSFTSNVQLHAVDMGPAFLVTSVLGGDDTSAVVASLGVALARAGQDVVCVDADLGGSSLRSLLDMPEETGQLEDGIGSVLEGDIDASDALRDIPVRPLNDGTVALGRRREGCLMLLPAGASSGVAALGAPGRLAELARQLSQNANYVLFACPGLLSVPIGLSLASVVDGVIVVVRNGRTRRADAQRLRAALDALHVEKVALVLLEGRPLRRLRPALRTVHSKLRGSPRTSVTTHRV